MKRMILSFKLYFKPTTIIIIDSREGLWSCHSVTIVGNSLSFSFYNGHLDLIMKKRKQEGGNQKERRKPCESAIISKFVLHNLSNPKLGRLKTTDSYLVPTTCAEWVD